MVARASEKLRTKLQIIGMKKKTIKPRTRGPTKLQKINIFLSERCRIRFTVSLCSLRSASASAGEVVLKDFMNSSFLNMRIGHPQHMEDVGGCPNRVTVFTGRSKQYVCEGVRVIRKRPDYHHIL